MPYQGKGTLRGECASKTGHLDVINNPFIKQLVEQFHQCNPPKPTQNIPWSPISTSTDKFDFIFAVDGSFQTISSQTDPPRVVSFVKTALLRIDFHALSKLDQEFPHPFALREILADSAIYHSTLFPLKNTGIQGLSVYHCIRKIIYESIKNDHLNGEPLKTLKWIAYRKWQGIPQDTDEFHCPHCLDIKAKLKYDMEVGNCPNCQGELFITDWIGFHMDMNDNFDSVQETIVNSYMLIHEILLLFTGIRIYWDNNDFQVLNDSLFIKDGPLSFRAQYTKFVGPIRDFLSYAYSKGVKINIIGQEKSGQFVDHLELIGKLASEHSYYIPNQDYIHKEIIQHPEGIMPYGYQHSFGSKLFCKFKQHELICLSTPLIKFQKDPKFNDFINLERIFATLPSLISHRYENALYPIELAHGIASLSTYPSAEILRLFLEKK